MRVVRRMVFVVGYCILLPVFFSLAATDSPRPKFWYVGSGAGIATPFFFGLINDIYATIPAAPVVNVFGGYEMPLADIHSLAFELDAMQTTPVTASEENFRPTVSSAYPAGSTIQYRNAMQTVVIASARYSIAVSENWNFFARLGLGARGLGASIELVAPSGAVYQAPSPSGIMAIFSAGFGVEWNAGVWGRFSVSYQSVPPVVYRAGTGTTTVRSSDMFLLQWRYGF